MVANVMLIAMILCGIAEVTGNPCYGVCFLGCTDPLGCKINPFCVMTCAINCRAGDNCKYRSSSVALQNVNQHEEIKEDAKHYCEVGCTSSVCSAITATLHLNSSADHVGEEAVELCKKACSGTCTKHFGTAVVTD